MMISLMFLGSALVHAGAPPDYLVESGCCTHQEMESVQSQDIQPRPLKPKDCEEACQGIPNCTGYEVRWNDREKPKWGCYLFEDMATPTGSMPDCEANMGFDQQAYCHRMGESLLSITQPNGNSTGDCKSCLEKACPGYATCMADAGDDAARDACAASCPGEGAAPQAACHDACVKDGDDLLGCTATCVWGGFMCFPKCGAFSCKVTGHDCCAVNHDCEVGAFASRNNTKSTNNLTDHHAASRPMQPSYLMAASAVLPSVWTEPTALPTPLGDGCVNDDTWISSSGSSCADYESLNYCVNGDDYGSGWDSEWGTFADFANDAGVDATQACCVCKPEEVPTAHPTPVMENTILPRQPAVEEIAGYLYWDDNQLGEQKALMTGDVADAGFWNDKASSVKVQFGYVCTFWWNADFQYNPITVHGPVTPGTSTMANFGDNGWGANDQISSWKCERTCDTMQALCETNFDSRNGGACVKISGAYSRYVRCATCVDGFLPNIQGFCVEEAKSDEKITATLLPTQPTTAEIAGYVFQDADKSGGYRALMTGDTANLDGNWNDHASSAQVYFGYHCTFWWNQNFDYNPIKIAGPQDPDYEVDSDSGRASQYYNFGGNGWNANDQISSWKCWRSCDTLQPTCAVPFNGHPNNNGTCVTVEGAKSGFVQCKQCVEGYKADKYGWCVPEYYGGASLEAPVLLGAPNGFFATNSVGASFGAGIPMSEDVLPVKPYIPELAGYLYSDENRGGQRLNAMTGDHSSMGNWNDKASSAQVFYGYTCTFWWNINFNYNPIIINGPTNPVEEYTMANFGNNGWGANKKISSFKCQRTCNTMQATCQVPYTAQPGDDSHDACVDIAYAYSRYVKCTQCKTGYLPNPQGYCIPKHTPQKERSITGVQLPVVPNTNEVAGYVYQDADLNGGFIKLMTGGTPSLSGDWNDHASSAKVYFGYNCDFWWNKDYNYNIINIPGPQNPAVNCPNPTSVTSPTGCRGWEKWNFGNNGWGANDKISSWKCERKCNTKQYNCMTSYNSYPDNVGACVPVEGARGYFVKCEECDTGFSVNDYGWCVAN